MSFNPTKSFPPLVCIFSRPCSDGHPFLLITSGKQISNKDALCFHAIEIEVHIENYIELLNSY